MLAAFSLVADAASEGQSVVLSMLVVGLIFVGVIALGMLTHYFGHKRQAAKRRPLSRAVPGSLGQRRRRKGGRRALRRERSRSAVDPLIG